MRLLTQPRAQTDPERITLGVASLAGVLALLWLTLTPRTTPKGPWHRLTGLPCPFCGGTRSVTSLLLEADIPRAFLFNPLVALASLAAPFLLLYLLVVVLFDLPRIRISAVSPPEARAFRIATLLLLAANWAYLLLVHPLP